MIPCRTNVTHCIEYNKYKVQAITNKQYEYQVVTGWEARLRRQEFIDIYVCIVVTAILKPPGESNRSS